MTTVTSNEDDAAVNQKNTFDLFRQFYASVCDSHGVTNKHIFLPVVHYHQHQLLSDAQQQQGKTSTDDIDEGKNLKQQQQKWANEKNNPIDEGKCYFSHRLLSNSSLTFQHISNLTNSGQHTFLVPDKTATPVPEKLKIQQIICTFHFTKQLLVCSDIVTGRKK